MLNVALLMVAESLGKDKEDGPIVCCCCCCCWCKEESSRTNHSTKEGMCTKISLESLDKQVE